MELFYSVSHSLPKLILSVVDHDCSCDSLVTKVDSSSHTVPKRTSCFCYDVPTEDRTFEGKTFHWTPRSIDKTHAATT